MRGSVVAKKDVKGRNRYYCVIEGVGRKRLWFSDPDTNSGFTNKGKAEAHLATLVVARNKGELVANCDTTLGEWALAWLKSRESDLKPSTWSSYERNIRNHIIPPLGGLRLQRLTVAHLDDWMQQLATSGKKLKGKDPQPLSQRTLNYVAVILKAILADAVDRPEPLLARNPADGMTVPKVEDSDGDHDENEIDFWTAAELDQFLDHIEGHRYGPLLTFLALTGARRGEALALRIRDVDLDNRVAAISKTMGRVAGKGLVTTSAKTKTGKRPISLDDDLVAAVEMQLEQQAEDRRLIGPGYVNEGGLLFADPTGGPINPDAVSRHFVRESHAAGLRQIRLHDLRHTWASIALRSGVPTLLVSERLGHASPAFTMSVYQHLMPTAHAEAAAQVTAAIRGASKRKRTGLRAV